MSAKRKIFVVFGTRPEAIKLAPLVKELETRKEVDVKTCVFRQHDVMLSQVLTAFNLKPTYDLKVVLNDQSIFGGQVGAFTRIKNLGITGINLLRFVRILRSEKPDVLVVQGDTSTAFLAAFLAFHFKISVAHVEAGLRTNKKYSPFPEEMNRRLITSLADFHFASTADAEGNLLREGIAKNRIWITGNTVIDAMRLILERHTQGNNGEYWHKFFKQEYGLDMNGKKIVLVTAHRRESFGDGLNHICEALKTLSDAHPDIQIIYPVHLNPNVDRPVRAILAGSKNIMLTTPLAYEPFIYLMSRAYLILTDSGGIQEEASLVGKPVLVMREVTERQEAIDAGSAKLVGTDSRRIVAEASLLLDNKEAYAAMAKKHTAFGDGFAARKIADVLVAPHTE